jgi:hypothetical protein
MLRIPDCVGARGKIERRTKVVIFANLESLDLQNFNGIVVRKSYIVGFFHLESI